jgi:hypothetical protein
LSYRHVRSILYYIKLILEAAPAPVPSAPKPAVISPTGDTASLPAGFQEATKSIFAQGTSIVLSSSANELTLQLLKGFWRKCSNC